jgi:FAD/FMN-containing dehydrogenase
MRRRTLLAGSAALACTGLPRPTLGASEALARVLPGDPAWPTDEDWAALGRNVEGRLRRLGRARGDHDQALLANPFYVGDQADLTESAGWLDGWTSAPSAYVLRAGTAEDVAAAVSFARARRLRLVVKGGGHSYVGGSNAPGSLLIWTRDMDQVELHDSFTPVGQTKPEGPAVTVGAGCLWGRVYEAVTTKSGRYVQGGGCMTVGVAGLVQGGGFGSYSKRFGLAAASLLQAEIVTADGRIRTINAVRDPDLFWALKGGGGGTFGVVTKLTLRTHELPATFGAIRWTVRAKSDAAFLRLLDRFLDHCRANLTNPHWGEQVVAKPDNSLAVELNYQGLAEPAVRSAWAALEAFVTASPADYESGRLNVIPITARRYWDPSYFEEVAPAAIRRDDRPAAQPGDFWWSGDGQQASAFVYSIVSAWLPRALLDDGARGRLATAWFAASREWPMALHLNKGLAGADAPTLAASRDTSMNPQVLDAFALAITGGFGPAGQRTLTPAMVQVGRVQARRAAAAIRALKQVAPSAGAYLSECDYFLTNWREAAWGRNWRRLDTIKRRYDPDDLFVVHHGIGSERWNSDGVSRAT